MELDGTCCFFVGRFRMIVNGLPKFPGFTEFTVSCFLKFHQTVGKLLVETANICECGVENGQRTTVDEG